MRHEIRERNHMMLQMAAVPGFRLTAWLVLEQLTRWENSITGYTQPGQEVIGRAIRRSRKAVNQAVAWLREHEFIKTQQRYVLRKDQTLFGTLRYWVAKELGQVEWLRNQKMTKRLRSWVPVKNMTERQDEIAKRWRMPKPGSKADVERYWLEKSGCNLGVSTPSITQSNTETLMSPALKKWLEEDKRRRDACGFT